MIFWQYYTHKTIEKPRIPEEVKSPEKHCIRFSLYEKLIVFAIFLRSEEVAHSWYYLCLKSKPDKQIETDRGMEHSTPQFHIGDHPKYESIVKQTNRLKHIPPLKGKHSPSHMYGKYQALRMGFLSPYKQLELWWEACCPCFLSTLQAQNYVEKVREDLCLSGFNFTRDFEKARKVIN